MEVKLSLFDQREKNKSTALTHQLQTRLCAMAQNIFFIFWWVQIFLLLSGMSRATCGVIENIVNLIHCSFCVTTDPYCQLITSLEGRTSFFGENDILFAVFPLVEIKLSIEFLKHY